MDETVERLSPRTITVWSDIGCPWASLALHVLRSEADRLGAGVLIDHRAFPLELFNRRPTPKPVIDVEVSAIAALIDDLGWRVWSAPDSEYPVTTIPAMAAVQAAKHDDVGGLAASDQLDAGLRRAWYAESRCISVLSVIEDVAAECPLVATDALMRRLREGGGMADVHEQFDIARGPQIQGSPHLFSDGYSVHNPGVRYHWTAPPPQGFPRFEAYDRGWVADLLTGAADAQRTVCGPAG
ncbi:DsbA family oxidoreductase [Mycolicibacterium sp. XJ870]